MFDKSPIKLALNVDVIVDSDFQEEKTDVRKAMVYDVKDKQIILSQTEPPFTNHDVGKEVILTYLKKEKNRPVREGFYSKIIEIIKNYDLVSLKNITAIVVKPETNPKPFDLRMHYRLFIPEFETGIGLIFGDKKVTLCDISIGGALFSHVKTEPIKSTKIVNVTLVIDNKNFPLKAKVSRVWSTNTKKTTGREFVGVHFLNMDRKLNALIGKKILTIQRTLVSKGMLS